MSGEKSNKMERRGRKKERICEDMSGGMMSGKTTTKKKKKKKKGKTRTVYMR